MAEQRYSFAHWMLQVERELLASRGIELAEAVQFVPAASLSRLWELGMLPERVADLVAIKIAATAV